MTNINIKTSQDAANAYASFDVPQVKSVSVGDMDAFEAVEQVQYDKSGGYKTNAQTVMNHFDEYRRDMQEKAKEHHQEEVTDEQQAREDAKEIARSLSTEEIKKLRMMGVDVSSASLSDIMGMVTSMRDAEHKDALANVVAQAQVERGDVSNLVFTGSGVQIAGTDADLKVGNREILYLLMNKQPLNQENLYKAHFSGQRDIPNQNQEEMPDSLLKQMEQIIRQCGMEVNAVSIDGAKQLVSHDIPLTPDSMRAYMDMHAQIGTKLADIPSARDMEEADGQEITERANALVFDVAHLSETDIIRAIQNDRPITIASMTAARSDAGKTETIGNSGGQSERTVDIENGQDVIFTQPEEALRQVTARRQLEEIRLSMTQKVAVRMIKADINIDTRDLSQVVATLRSVEEQLTGQLLAKQGIVADDADILLVSQMRNNLQTIGDAPVEHLGRMISYRGAFTVRNVADVVTQTLDKAAPYAKANASAELSGDTIRRVQVFSQMEQEYEALSTAPRADMGDSIGKAFANVSDILQDMGLPADEEHVRAVRILGYNSIQINEENVQTILQYDREVNDLILACRPEAVYGMIQDGINPLDVPIEELNRILREKSYKAGVSETEDFATFLRDMERKGNIDAEERSAYIGMYRVLKKLEKSGDREAGYLFANNARLTVQNLITAMRSRKARGMDVSVDDAFGMTESIEYQGERMDEQIARAFSGNQNMSEQTDAADENPWQDISESEQLADMEQILQESGVEESALNLQAVSAILQDMPGHQMGNQPDFYSLVAQMMKKLSWKETITEDAVDEETGAMAKSMSGEEIPLPFEPEHLLELLRKGEDLSVAYADLQQQLVERMYVGAEDGTISSDDLMGMKVVQAGFRVLGGLARENRYQLPVMTQTGMKIVNLTVQGETSSRGMIEIRMVHAGYESLTANIRTEADGTCIGEIFAGTAEGNEALLRGANTFFDMLSESGYADARITFGQKNRDMDGRSNLHVSTQKLCETAVFFVKALADLSDI